MEGKKGEKHRKNGVRLKVNDDMEVGGVVTKRKAREMNGRGRVPARKRDWLEKDEAQRCL